jgi:hypothetical protein
MKNLLVAIGLLTASVAYGQEQQDNTKWFMVKQECKPVAEFMAQVVGRWSEHALFSGKGVTIGALDGMPYNGGVMLFVNQDSGTWTLGTMYSNGMVCISAAGTEFVPYSG